MPYWIVDAGTDIDISKFWKSKNCIGYSNSIDEVKKKCTDWDVLQFKN